jgi:hypothetical protein
MALEPLAGPFTILNRLTEAPVGKTIAGAPIWIDGRGLLLPISSEGVYLVQMDGAAYPVATESNDYGLALIGAGGAPSTRPRWYGLSDSLGTYGEWDIDAVTLFKTDRVGDSYVTLGRNYARLHDRYVYPLAGRIYARPLDLSASGIIEASMNNLTHGVSLSWAAGNELVVGSSDGQVVRYDWIKKSFVGALRTIGMTCLGLWWSAKHGVHVSLHDAGETLALRVWAATVRPAVVGAPVPEANLTAGRRTRIRATVLGAHADPCAGEVVAWSLSGPGTLAPLASYTDDEGVAETWYATPLNSGGEDIQIGAEVAV